MTTVSTGTPVISVTDNRGLIVRTLNWNRTTASGETTLLVTHALVADDTRTSSFRDPRLFAARQADDTTGVNLTTFSSLAGQPLRRDSTDSGQNITVFDAEGRPAWSRDPAGTVMTWAYDELGRPVTTLQQLSTETVTAALFVYGDSDPQTVNPQNNNLCGVCVRQYDEGGLLTTGSVALSGATLSTSQTFLLDAEHLPDWPDDEAGRSALLESTTYTTTGQADALARTTARTDASGHTVSMTYDVSGVPVTQSLQLKDQSTDTPLLMDLTLSAAGQVLSETAGNGVTTTYSYEEGTLRLSGIAAVRTGDSTVLQSLGYAYDPVGNVTTVSDATVSRSWFRNQATDGSRSFTYDAIYQLLSATGRENVANGAQSSGLPVMQSLNDSQTVNYTRSYSYDNSGNLTTLTHTGAVSSTMTMVTDGTSNRSVRQNKDDCLTPGMDWSAWYTPSGQLKTLQTEGGKPATGYTDSGDPLKWDRNTRLQGVTLVSRSSTEATQNDREMYQYRGGMRVRKQTRTLTNATSGLWTVNEVRYLPGLEVRNSWQETVTGNSATAPDYQEQLEVVTAQAGRSQIRVLHWVTSPPSGVSNDQIRYGVDDNIGSMQLELDDSGQLISREVYYPYGGTAVWAGRSQIEADYKTVRYSGQERDGTGLYYYGYRYYAPWLCRWTASDPAREIDGLNLFRMAENNPVTYPDTLGLVIENSKLKTGDDRNRAGASLIIPSRINNIIATGEPIKLEDALTEHALSTTPLLTDLINPTKVDMDNTTKDVLSNENLAGGVLAFNSIHFYINESNEINALHIVDKKTSDHQAGRGVTLAYWVPQGGYVDIPTHPQKGEPELVFTPGFSGCTFVADKLDEKTIRVRHVQGGKEDLEYNNLADIEHGEGMISAMQYSDYGYHNDEQGNLKENITGSAFMIYERNRWNIKFQSLANTPGISSLKENSIGFFKKRPQITGEIRYYISGKNVVNMGVIPL